MSEEKYTPEEQRARREAYEEYLRLRQEAPKVSITETPYGSSQMRQRQKEEAEAAYREARASGRAGRSSRKPARSEGRSAESGKRSRKQPAPRRKQASSGERKARPQQGSSSSQKRRAAGSGAGRRPSGKKRPEGGIRGRVAQAMEPRDLERRPIAENSTMEQRPLRKKKGRHPAARGGLMRKKGVRRAIAILIVAILAFIALVVGAFTVAAGTLSRIGSLDIDKNEIGISEQAKSSLKDFENIAVLGVDSRDMEDDSESRSDAMVIVSINKETDEVKMFSVFRDTMLYLGEEHGLDKVTHAYSYGGAQASLFALNKNIDLNVKKAVVINWKTVAEVIDTLGGIEIDVQESEIEELNKYVGGTAKRTGSEKIEVEKAGKQTLNGAQAVTYARIRKDAVTGDYRRNERMKIVMTTTFKKAKQADLFTLKKICDNALPQAKTNLSTTQMMSLALKFRKLNMTSTTTGWPYDVEGWIGTAGGGSAWYGPPRTLESNVKKLYKKFFGIAGYTPSHDVQSISNDIVELTGLD